LDDVWKWAFSKAVDAMQYLNYMFLGIGEKWCVLQGMQKHKLGVAYLYHNPYLQCATYSIFKLLNST
jgi:hypothetical protein